MHTKWYLPQVLPGAVVRLFLVSSAVAKTIHVEGSAAGANDGTSWTNAFVNLSVALTEADPGEEIRVARGVHRPASPNGDRGGSFNLGLANGAKIRGGYAGLGAPDPGVRDVVTYPTILSGDLNGDDGPGGRMPRICSTSMSRSMLA